MDKIVDRLVSFVFMFAVLFGLGALLRIACPEWNWSLNVLMSAICAFGIVAICHD